MPLRGSSQRMSCANTPKTGVETRRPLPGIQAVRRYSMMKSSLCVGEIDGVAGRLESSTAASRSNDRIQVIEVLLQRTSAGRGQPVISPRCAAFKRFVA